MHLVAPGAQLLIVRVLDANGNGDFVNVAAGVRWAVENGAKVINLSLGSSANGKADALQNALEDAQALGVIVTSAAGNQAVNQLDFPGRSAEQVTCVAAVDANGAGAAFSNYDHSHVALSAPGVAVRSTYPGGRYRLWSGTSMSAPFVAGTAALLAELHPSWAKLEMEARLASTCQPITRVPINPDPTLQTQPRDFGPGTLDVGAALAPDFVPGPNQNPDPEGIRPH